MNTTAERVHLAVRRYISDYYRAHDGTHPRYILVGHEEAMQLRFNAPPGDFVIGERGEYFAGIEVLEVNRPYFLAVV